MLDSSTIDPYEVEYYQKMASLWWDNSGPFWPLHKLIDLRLQWIKQTLFKYQYSINSSTKPLCGLNVLDIGCGGGILAESLAKLGAFVHGSDVVEKNVHIARAHASENNLSVNYSYTSVEELNDRGEKYDVVFNMEVVEHVANFDKFMHECSGLLKPDGAMFVASINRTLLTYFSAIVGAEYVLRWLPKGTHRYSMLRKPDEVISQLKIDGVETKELIGVGVNPITWNFSFSKYTSINYMLFAQKD